MFEAIVDLMTRLAVLPGLGFLRSYSSKLKTIKHNIQLRKQGIVHRKQSYENALKAARDFPAKVKGSKKRG